MPNTITTIKLKLQRRVHSHENIIQLHGITKQTFTGTSKKKRKLFQFISKVNLTFQLIFNF